MKGTLGQVPLLFDNSELARFLLTLYHTTECIVFLKEWQLWKPSPSDRLHDRPVLALRPFASMNARGYRKNQYAGLLAIGSTPKKPSNRFALSNERKQLGFSLKEIAELLTLRVDRQTECSQVKERATAKLVEVERKMVELQRMRQALLQVASLCEGEGPKGRCPMLDALEHDSENE